MIAGASVALFSAMVIASEGGLSERLAPVGKTCMAGDTSCASAASNSASSGEPRSGQQVFDESCTTCHAGGMPNAPALGDAAAWGPRADKGIEELYNSAINGFNNNAMPARGLCMNCSDDEIKAAVDYMVENSK